MVSGRAPPELDKIPLRIAFPSLVFYTFKFWLAREIGSRRASSCRAHPRRRTPHPLLRGGWAETLALTGSTCDSRFSGGLGVGFLVAWVRGAYSWLGCWGVMGVASLAGRGRSLGWCGGVGVGVSNCKLCCTFPPFLPICFSPTFFWAARRVFFPPHGYGSKGGRNLQF